MSYSEEYLLRYVLRKIRKEKGLRLKDIEDYHISASSISNIERGEEVREETFDYYLQKIGLDQDQLKDLISKEREEIAELQFTLEVIEAMLERGDKTTAKEQLALIQIDDFHPLAPLLSYLKGFQYKHDDWKKAQKYFQRGVRLCHQYKIELTDNIISACYNQLSICSFNQNNLDEAIDYTIEGLRKYNPSLERKDIKYSLLSNQILYYMKTSQSDQASQVLNEVWNSIGNIERNTVILNLHKHRSIILRDRKNFAEAIQICNKAIQLARMNVIPNRYLDLLNVLGTIYLKQRKWEKALNCFQQVLTMDHKGNFSRRHLDAHTYLGIVYSNQKKWEQAKQHLTKAIGTGRNIADIFRLAKALIVLGDCFFKQNRWEEAIPYYQEAVEITQKHGYQQRMHTALTRLARCFDILNDQESMVRCMKQILKLQNNLNLKSEDEIYVEF